MFLLPFLSPWSIILSLSWSMSQWPYSFLSSFIKYQPWVSSIIHLLSACTQALEWSWMFMRTFPSLEINYSKHLTWLTTSSPWNTSLSWFEYTIFSLVFLLPTWPLYLSHNCWLLLFQNTSKTSILFSWFCSRSSFMFFLNSSPRRCHLVPRISGLSISQKIPVMSLGN